MDNLKRRKLGLFIAALMFGTILSACLPGRGDKDPCNEEGTLLLDDFEGTRNCGWKLYNGRGVAEEIADGVLRIATNQPGQIGWTLSDRKFDDVIITVEARQVAGPDDNAYGVICRYQSPENFYLFLISGDGYYSIGKYQAGSVEVQYLTEGGQFQPADAINQGNAANQIRASCIGNELSLSINGIPVDSVSDPTFVTGDLGLAASTFQPGSATIEFESIRVIAP